MVGTISIYCHLKNMTGYDLNAIIGLLLRSTTTGEQGELSLRITLPRKNRIAQQIDQPNKTSATPQSNEARGVRGLWRVFS